MGRQRGGVGGSGEVSGGRGGRVGKRRHPRARGRGVAGHCSRTALGTDGSAGLHEAPVAVLDVLRIPDDLPPGDYVLGWRYDCEATAQVWANCADITLVR